MCIRTCIYVRMYRTHVTYTRVKRVCVYKAVCSCLCDSDMCVCVCATWHCKLLGSMHVGSSGHGRTALSLGLKTNSAAEVGLQQSLQAPVPTPPHCCMVATLPGLTSRPLRLKCRQSDTLLIRNQPLPPPPPRYCCLAYVLPV